MNKYFLSEHLIFTRTSKVEIAKERYDKIEATLSSLYDLLELEETFDVLIRNYAELEKFCIGLAVEAAVNNFNTDYQQGLDTREINRHMLNLFTTARLYLDQMNSKRRQWFGENSTQWDKIEEVRTSQYSNLLGYRFLEGLRNHAQHKGVPVHHLTYFANWLYGNDESLHRLEYCVIPFGELSMYIRSKKIKATILEELENHCHEGRLDLRPFVRDYITGLGEIQGAIRNAIRENYIEWCGVLVATIQNWKSCQTDRSEPKILSMWIGDDREVRISKPTFLNMSNKELIDDLQEKNRGFTNLKNRFSSNAIDLRKLAPPKFSD